MCDNGECVTSDERCDGWIDCSDVSDENYCAGDTSSGVYISHSLTLDSFPGLPRGEGRPGTHCSRMRRNFDILVIPWHSRILSMLEISGHA